MPLNDTKFTYLGHATVLIETPGGKRLLIDPFLQGNPRCPDEWKSPARLGKLDLILLTHIHDDHASDVLSVAQANPDAKVVAIVEACNWLHSIGVTNYAYMNIGGTQVLEGISITMTQAIHTSSTTGPDGKLIHGGEPAGYILKLENGFTVYEAGDTALFGDMALLKELYAPDIAILPIGDHFTMGPREAAYAIKLLGVKHVLPVHYATFPILTGTLEALQTQTAGIEGLNIHALQPGETL